MFGNRKGCVEKFYKAVDDTYKIIQREILELNTPEKYLC